MTHLGFPIETVVVFIVFSLGAIAIDMFAHKKDSAISLKSASLWSLFWITVSILFGGYLWFHHGSEVASMFFTGYALEKVLSVDNLFVMMAIFSWFKVPEQYRHRVLYWGILGAIVFRMIFVAIGTGLLSLGAYVELIFAIIIGWTGIMMFKSMKEENQDEEDVDYSQHLAYRLVHKFFPVSKTLHGHNFFIHKKDIVEMDKNNELEKVLDESTVSHLKDVGLSSGNDKHIHAGKVSLIATPLFLCLAIIELSDVMFAFDSVPAVIAVSREPLIVYSAMMFAILGLRTMYFVLEALKKHLVHLEKAVVALLFFVAFKLGLSATNHLFHHGFEISANLSLIIVLITLSVGIVASFIWKDNLSNADESKQNQ